MSILRFANGQKLKIEQPILNPQGNIENRVRPTLDFTVTREDIRALGDIENLVLDNAAVEHMTLYFNEENPQASDDQLNGVGGDPDNAPAKQQLDDYSVLGKLDKEKTVVQEGTLKAPPVYGWKLTVQLGQRLWDEQ